MRPAIWLAPRSPSSGLYGRTRILSSLAGLLLSARGEHRGALRLLGARSRVYSGRGLSREVGALVVDDQTIKVVARAALGDAGCADAWVEGESMTVARASTRCQTIRGCLCKSSSQHRSRRPTCSASPCHSSRPFSCGSNAKECCIFRKAAGCTTWD